VTISRGVNGFTRARHLRRCHAHGATPGLRPANRRQLRFSLQDLEPGPRLLLRSEPRRRLVRLDDRSERADRRRNRRPLL